MPIYNHRCIHCGLCVEILRSFAEYKNSPNEEEIAKVSPESTDKHYREYRKIDLKVEDCIHEFEITVGNTSFQLNGRGWAKDGYE